MTKILLLDQSFRIGFITAFGDVSNTGLFTTLGRLRSRETQSYLSVKGNPSVQFVWASIPGGGGHLSFQDTGLYHSNRKSTTINPEKSLKSKP